MSSDSLLSYLSTDLRCACGTRSLTANLEEGSEGREKLLQSLRTRGELTAGEGKKRHTSEETPLPVSLIVTLIADRDKRRAYRAVNRHVPKLTLRF
ncbi:hypothetical protein RRG08_036460 [Elysia crispata]|uniref:Uncharacterized protein n=1 Tax=Elysia crispata TaxID=231223 RepID=A0AAE0ZKH6_9GAST|nr:hypothetical protein RRG08_036460 [Elysia crispata]